MFYVLHVSGDAPWILNLEAHPRDKCARSIAWQVEGGATRDEWRICTFDAERRVFVSDSGEEFKAARGPYTDEAWKDFQARVAA